MIFNSILLLMTQIYNSIVATLFSSASWKANIKQQKLLVRPSEAPNSLDADIYSNLAPTAANESTDENLA